MNRWTLTAALLLLGASFARGDKVIMKSGKIYEGRIRGETHQSILISNPPLDPTPRFLELRDILTIVHDTHPEPSPTEQGRYFMIETGLRGSVFSADTLTLHPAPALQVGGGLRIHPL